jgi:DNA helicase INO80
MVADVLTAFSTTGEGHFDDNKQPGTATPLEEAPSGSKKKGKSSKKAKTTKQRLAIADGMVD